MNPEWLKEIEEREAKATPGPWKCDECRVPEDRGDGIYYLIESPRTPPMLMSKGNADFLGAARTDIPTLLKALNKAYEALEKCRNQSGPKCQWCHERECQDWCPDVIVSEALAYNPTQEEATQ